MNYAHTMQIKFIRNAIRLMTLEQCEGVRGIIEKYPDNYEDKIEIMNMLKDKYEKRGWKWL